MNNDTLQYKSDDCAGFSDHDGIPVLWITRSNDGDFHIGVAIEPGKDTLFCSECHSPVVMAQSVRVRLSGARDQDKALELAKAMMYVQRALAGGKVPMLKGNTK